MNQVRLFFVVFYFLRELVVYLRRQRNHTDRGNKEKLLNRDVLLCTCSASLPQDDDDAWLSLSFSVTIPTTRDLNLFLERRKKEKGKKREQDYCWRPSGDGFAPMIKGLTAVQLTRPNQHLPFSYQLSNISVGLCFP